MWFMCDCGVRLPLVLSYLCGFLPFFIVICGKHTKFNLYFPFYFWLFLISVTNSQHIAQHNGQQQRKNATSIDKLFRAHIQNINIFSFLPSFNFSIINFSLFFFIIFIEFIEIQHTKITTENIKNEKKNAKRRWKDTQHHTPKKKVANVRCILDSMCDVCFKCARFWL